MQDGASKSDLRDDLGRPINGLTFEQAQGDHEALMTLQRLMQAERDWDKPVGPRTLSALLLFVLLGIVLMVLPRVLPSAPRVLIGVCAAISAIAISLLLVRSAPKPGRAAIIPTMLARGLCPGCAYPLEGIPTAPSGCIECPECGAAWRAERIGRSAVPPKPRTFTLWNMPAILDDRHRAIELTPPSLRPTHGQLSAERARAGRAAVRRATLGRRFLLGLPLLLITVVVGMAAGFAIRSPWVLIGNLLAISIWMYWLVAFALNRTMLTARQSRAALLSNRICPGCAADLTQAHRDRDSFITCPVCHAAWTIEPRP